MKIVKELAPVEFTDEIYPRRRIVVLERDDGYFTFAEEYYYVSWHEGKIIAEGWGTASTNGIYSDANTAEADAIIEFARRWKLCN